MDMSSSAPKPKIEKLQQQLTQLKEVYEERIRKGKEFSSLKPIETQIRELERAIRQFLADQ
jgi:hypothetical protein